MAWAFSFEILASLARAAWSSRAPAADAAARARVAASADTKCRFMGPPLLLIVSVRDRPPRPRLRRSPPSDDRLPVEDRVPHQAVVAPVQVAVQRVEVESHH